jgi:hypothetical protein
MKAKLETTITGPNQELNIARKNSASENDRKTDKAKMTNFAAANASKPATAATITNSQNLYDLTPSSHSRGLA